MPHKYSAKDVEKILGINPDKLFYWVKTKRLVSPMIEGKGRGKVNYYSFDNLFQLALIRNLTGFGIELNSIEEILKGPTKRPKQKARLKLTILEYYKAKKETLREQGFLLMIVFHGRKKIYYKNIGTRDVILDMLNFMWGYEETEITPFGDVILIDLLRIILAIEKIVEHFNLS